MTKLDRSTFLYLDPKGKEGNFAQCKTCMMWVPGKDRCTIHGPKITVPGTASCNLYVHGMPMPDAHLMAAVTPKESGLVNRAVQCHRCRHYDKEEKDCELFEELNKALPELFDLDKKVDPHGCCNAQQPIALIGMREEKAEKPTSQIGIASEKAVPGVYLVRHGKTSFNKETLGASADRIRGWMNVPLDAAGREQAQQLGKTVAKFRPAKIYSSDLQRAEDTAQAIAKHSNVEQVHTSRRFRPWNLGDLQGRKAKDAVPVIRRHVQDENKAVPDGESFASFKNRFLSALEDVLDEHKRTGKTLVLVAHYRNLKLADSWLAKGGKGRAIDPQVMMADDRPPGTIMRIVPGGDSWKQEVVNKGKEWGAS